MTIAKSENGEINLKINSFRPPIIRLYDFMLRFPKFSDSSIHSVSRHQALSLFPIPLFFFPISDICPRFVGDYSDSKTRPILLKNRTSLRSLYFWIRIFLHCIPFLSSTWGFFTTSPYQILTSFFWFFSFPSYNSPSVFKHALVHSLRARNVFD